MRNADRENKTRGEEVRNADRENKTRGEEVRNADRENKTRGATKEMTKQLLSKIMGFSITIGQKLILLPILVILADLLLFQTPPHTGIGIGLGLFALLLCLSVFFFSKQGRTYFWGILTCLSLLVLFESNSALSIGLFLTSSLSWVWSQNQSVLEKPVSWLIHQFGYLILMPFKFFIDMTRLYKITPKVRKHLEPTKIILNWLMPLSFAGLFFILFAQANPTFGTWWQKFDLWPWFKGFSTNRLFFWLGAAAFCWAYLYKKPLFHFTKQLDKIKTETHKDNQWLALLFSPTILLRSLIIFNLLFLVQNYSDVLFFLKDGHLPRQYTYSEYAHKGITPLTVAALLAGLFTLIATRKTLKIDNKDLMHILIYAWIAQTIFLTALCLWRLYLYVSVYSLTHMRVVGFIGIFLVMIWLIWIIFKIYLQKDNSWFVRMNSLSLLAVLFLCSFTDISRHIAIYNVKQSYELTGKGQRIHMDYLKSLGPSAIPAFNLLMNRSIYTHQDYQAAFRCENLIDDLNKKMNNWRGYHLRNIWLKYKVVKSLKIEEKSTAIDNKNHQSQNFPQYYSSINWRKKCQLNPYN